MVKSGQSSKPKRNLTRNQAAFADFLADPTNEESLIEFSKRTGIPVKKLREWKADPLVVQTAVQKSLTAFGADIPKALNMLLNKSLEKEDVSACKLFFQQLEKVAVESETGLSSDEALKLINKIVSGFESGKNSEGEKIGKS